MIPPTFIQELLSRVDIAELVGRHVQLKKGGANLLGLCPFHAEKSPSFTVSPSKQFYHCFGCGASGDAIRFLTEFSGMTFIDAVKDLAQQTGLTVPDDDRSPVDRERAVAEKEHRGTLTEMLVKAADHYRRQLRASPRAIDYLKGRGLDGAIAAQFGLGYAPDGWRGLASVFPRYDDPLLEEGGMVIVQNADGDEADKKRYDRFRDRIMFPIRSVQGEVIGFGGRVLDRGEPKYLNSPETPLFVKGRELYGLFEARTAVRQRGYALVVEGYMDVVALAQAGFGNAVATLGTACTAEHVQKLFRFTDAVVFSFDGDSAGRRAADRALEAALPHATDTRSVRFLYLPTEHDPDSYVRELGAAAFEQRIAEAVPLSRQVADSASEGKDLDTAEGRAHLLADARPLWAALPAGVLKRQLVGELAVLARLEPSELLALWGVAERRQSPAAAPARAPGRRAGRLAKGTASLLDRAVWLLLQRCELWSELDGESHDLLADQPAPYDLFFGAIERCLHDQGPLAPAALLTVLQAATAAAPDDTDPTVGGAAAEARGALARIAGFHAPQEETDVGVELAHVVAKLRLQAVDDELKALFESGVQSPDAQQRGRVLMETRRRLKA
jgi:DNA primase